MSNEMETIDRLARQLIQLQLVSAEEMQRCRSQLPRTGSDSDLLKILEQQSLITSYQITKIEKGDAASLIIGGCKLMYQNAAGSFARLYRGARLDNGQMIGVKILRDRWTKDPATIQLFRREGELGKRLKHPNIVPIFEVGQSGKFHYITMEFVEGGNLRDFLKIRGKLSPVEAVQYSLHICRALEAALKLGLTHRDMKTTNVLMSSQGVAKLIDFGLAADDAAMSRISNEELAQALEYSTLEKNTGAPKNDPRSDLFFLGTILYELLTGEPPYPRTKSRDERKNFSRYRDIQPVSTIDASLPRCVTSVVDKLLKTNPALRYQSPTEAIADLEQALKELGHVEQGAPTKTAIQADAKVVLIVESRPSRQDVLRDYFTKHGYRVVLLTDADRAIARLKTMTPRAVILFGDSLGDRVLNDFAQAVSQTKDQNVAVVAILGESHQGQKIPVVERNSHAIILKASVNLRELRNAIERVHGDAG